MCEKCKSVRVPRSQLSEAGLETAQTSLCTHRNITAWTAFSQASAGYPLPGEQEESGIIWMESEVHGEGDNPFEVTLFRDLLGDDSPLVDLTIAGRNTRRKYDILHHTLNVNHRDSFRNDGSTLNACVTELAREGRQHQWKGPIVLAENKGRIGWPECIYNRHQDVSLAGLRVAVDYFTKHNEDKLILRQDNAPLPSTHAPGVLVTCRGEQRLRRRAGFVAVAVPKSDLVFSSPDDRPSIPHGLGIPISARKHPLVHSPEECLGGNQWRELENISATWLHQDCRTHQNTGKN